MNAVSAAARVRAAIVSVDTAPFKLDVTKVATIRDFAAYGKVGVARRYYVRNFTLVGTPVLVG